MNVCSNHNGTTITPLADLITGFESKDLKSCPFCGVNTVNLVIFDEEGYSIDIHTLDNECDETVSRDEDGNPDIVELVTYWRHHIGEIADHYGIECYECGALVYGPSPEFAKTKWNRRAHHIDEWKSAFSPSEGIE